MLASKPFYHGTTRAMVVSFCGLFSNIFTVTKDTTNITKKIVNVPIAYANKEKFLVRLKQDPGLNEDIQIILPRLSAEIVGQEYDSARQLNKVNKNVCFKDGKTTFMYSPVPYNITFQLYSYTRTTEDNLQILEQIVPYFTPDMNLSIKVMQNPDFIQDCQLILNSVNTDDAYDGGFEERRYIITTYEFTLKMYYYSPIRGLLDSEFHFDNSNTAVNIIKNVQVNVNNNKYSVTVDPFEAGPDDPYTLNEIWSEEQNPISL